MKLLLMIAAAFLISCSGSDPASEESSSFNPDIHLLTEIELNGADLLALKERIPAPVSAGIPSTSAVGNGVADRCLELGQLNGVTYEELITRNNGNNQGRFTPCFKNIHFWGGDTIYGQYRPDDSDVDVWFITDSNGKVHHLPSGLKKGTGLKNDHPIRRYKGNPVYLNYSGILTAFNLETEEEETIINEQVGRFVILPKDNVEMIAYHDLNGGKIKMPDDSIQLIPEINTSKFYYKNGSNDLGYTSGMKFKNLILDEDGTILDRAGSAVPVALQAFYDTGLPGVPPASPIISGSIQACTLSENLMICEYSTVKGYIIPGSNEDIEEINWCSFGHCNLSTTLSCVNDQYIYFYSSNNVADWVLTQIPRDLSGFEHLLTNIEVSALTCLEDGNLLIKGLNMDSDQAESFHFDPALKVKTMITEDITEFIN